MSHVDFTAVCLGTLILTVSAALTGFAIASARSPRAGVWLRGHRRGGAHLPRVATGRPPGP